MFYYINQPRLKQNPVLLLDEVRQAWEDEHWL